MKDRQHRLSHLTVFLHWVVGLTVMALLAVGFYMSNTETRSLYPIHKSIGIAIFAVVLVRVVWRLVNGWPPAAARYQPWEKTLAFIVHWVLLIGTVLLPISGMMMSYMGGHGLAIFGWELLPNNPNPAIPGKTMPIDKAMSHNAGEAHEILGLVMAAAIALHIAGALKHHIIDKDGTLRRMWGQRI